MPGNRKDRRAQGGGRREAAVLAAGLILVVGLAVCIWLVYFRSFQGLFYNDAQDYASLARNIARGRGLISQYVNPLGLIHHGIPQPDLWRAPLWPLVLAAFQLIFGFTDRAAALAGGFCYVAAAGLTFLLGRRWFNLPVAVAASVLYLFSAQVLEFSTNGLTEPLATLLMLLWLWVLTYPRLSRWQLLLAGGMGGLFYLARYNAILFLVPGLVYLAWRRYRERRPVPRSSAGVTPVPENPSGQGGGAAGTPGWGEPASGRLRPAAGLVALFLAGFLLVSGPWFIRNQLLAGSPFFSLQKYEPVMFTPSYPGYSLYMRPLKVDVPAFLLTHRGEVWLKFTRNLHMFRQDFPYRDFTGFALRVFACFLLALVLPLDRAFPAQRGVRPLLVACFGLQLVALLFLHYIPRLFMIFIPFYSLYAAAGVWWVASRAAGMVVAAGRRGDHRGEPPPGETEAGISGVAGWKVGSLSAVAAGVVLLAFTLLGVTANLPNFHPRHGPHPTLLWGEGIREVRSLVPPDRVVVSDNGQILAWYGERYACKLPWSPELLPAVARLAPVRALFLTSWITWAQPDASSEWVRVYHRRPPELYGFRLTRVYPDGSLLYLKP